MLSRFGRAEMVKAHSTLGVLFIVIYCIEGNCTRELTLTPHTQQNAIVTHEIYIFYLSYGMCALKNVN